MQVSRQRLREIIAKDLQAELNGHYFDIVAEEVRPYFRQVILEERRQIRNQLLYMHRKGTISDLVVEQILLERPPEGAEYFSGSDKGKEEKPAEEEEESWYVGLAKDVGLGIGQMMGGGIGIAAGIAGITRYMPMFRKNIDKGFLNWIGPFISLFFSVTAIIYPAPGAKSLGEVLRGMFKGIKDIISGTASIFAKGVSKVFSKGAEYFGKAISLFGKLIKGVGSGIKGGGEIVTKIGNAIGGGNVLKSLFGQLSKAATELSKRLDALAKMLKAAKEIKQNGGSIKDVVTAAFQGPVGSIGQRVKDLIQGSKAVKAVIKAKTAAGKALETTLKSISFLKATDDVAAVSLKGITSTGGTNLSNYSIKGISNGRIYLESAKGSSLYVSADTTAKILAKNPAVKKWVMTGLSDDAAKQLTKALPAATSTARATGKAVVDTIKNMPNNTKEKFFKMMLSAEKRIMQSVGEGFPKIFAPLIGQSFKMGNHSAKIISIGEGGRCVVQIGKFTHNNMMLNAVLASANREFSKQFISIMRTVVGERAASSFARFIASTSKMLASEEA